MEMVVDLLVAVVLMPLGEETVTIPKEEYEDLIRSKKILDALYAGGVDNWDWYGQSLEDAGID
jgi:hypothetical protein